VQIEKEPDNGILEEFRINFWESWPQLPNKGFFFLLLAAWLALFFFLGNATVGYIHSRSPSLYRWMLDAYHPGGNYAESEDGHGVIVPFVVIALFWWKRKQLLAQPLRVWTPGLLLVIFALFIHLAGFLGQQPKISVIALFAGIYGLMGLAWGPAWLKACFFPFFLFAFCVPLGLQAQVITFPLRLLVSQMVSFFANGLLAIDVQRIGTQLLNPSGNYFYEVAAACSGLRSLIATLGISIVYGFVTFPAWWKRLLLIAAAFPLAVFGNFIRMMAIILAAEIGGQKWGNYVHEGGPKGLLSLIPYIPAFIGLMLLGHWLRERSSTATTMGLERRRYEWKKVNFTDRHADFDRK
jgi:exosortase